MASSTKYTRKQVRESKALVGLRCYVCGGRGMVPKGYTDAHCSLKESQNLVKCPRCNCDRVVVGGTYAK